MNSGVEQISSRYFNSWWIPSALYLILLISFVVPAVLNRAPDWPWLSILCDIHFGIVVVAFAGVPSAAAWNLIRKRWANGVINGILFLACCIVSIVATFAVMMCIRTGQ